MFKNKKGFDMPIMDWHTHNALCRHATGTLEDYVKKGIELNLHTLGLSDHFPYSFLDGIERLPVKEYAMTLDEIEQYLTTAEKLKKVYQNQIHIKIGFEIDYIDNQVNKFNFYFNSFKSRSDFIIASIHVLNSERGLWGMDDIMFSKEYDAIGTDNVYSQYYQGLRKMINTKEFDFDIIGHLDLPKKFNKIPKNKKLIMSEVDETLELAKKRDITIEINTAGFRKDVKEQYPSIEIIKKLYELDIPILLGSDAHSPNELAWQFKSIIKTLKRIGYDQLAIFEKRKRSFIEI